MSFIVVFDDEQGLCVPMGWDTDCDGAVCACHDSVALFPDRTAARKAIRVSTAFAKLCVEQGVPANDDFTTGRKNLRILPLQARAVLLGGQA